MCNEYVPAIGDFDDLPQTEDICFRLVQAIFGRRGIELPELHECVNLFDEIEGPEPYAVVVFGIHSPYPSHMGVVMPDKQAFIHASQKTGITVSRLLSMAWMPKIRGFYRYTGGK